MSAYKNQQVLHWFVCRYWIGRQLKWMWKGKKYLDISIFRRYIKNCNPAMLLLFHVLGVLQWYYTAISNECTIQNDRSTKNEAPFVPIWHCHIFIACVDKNLYRKWAAAQSVVTSGCELSCCSNECPTRISDQIGEKQFKNGIHHCTLSITEWVQAWHSQRHSQSSQM